MWGGGRSQDRKADGGSEAVAVDPVARRHEPIHPLHEGLVRAMCRGAVYEMQATIANRALPLVRTRILSNVKTC